MNLVLYSLVVLGSYLVGSIPFGLLISRLFTPVDIRTVGSGNIGATNVLRAAGKVPAVLTLLADALKGCLPVLGVRLMLGDDTLAASTAAAAVLGHNFPVYLRFKGGKGVATGYGVILALMPWTGLACLVIWLATALLWRYSSLAALVSYAGFPLIIFSSGEGTPKVYGVLSLFLFGLIYYRHRENIKRLLAGTESKIGKS